MRIFTLTLSPAFDRYCRAEKLALNEENLVQTTTFTAGGKGINVSRALCSVGIPSTAVLLLGRENGDDFARQVTTLGVELLPILVEGKIRENITIATPEGETRISFPSPYVEAAVVREAFERLSSLISEGDILVLAGRLPQGTEVGDILPYLAEFKCKGINLVIDSKSFSLADLTELSPWLVKPNEEEVRAYCGRAVNTRHEAEIAAQTLHQKGIENVMVSLGDKGAVLVNREGKFACNAPKISVRSSVGAGDSSIAGFLSAHYKGLNAAEKLKHAVAFGSAACLSDGPLPPQKTDIDEILK